MNKLRGISSEFINDFLAGGLNPLLQYVHKDHTLDLEIRESYINIYYRGGNILDIEELSPGNYKYSFDYNYLNGTSSLEKTIIENHLKSYDWIDYFPKAKQAMDFFFTKKRCEEREFQQLVVRENNYSSVANATDYFIIDIEYDNHKNARFDLVAIEWPSKGQIRKLAKNYRPKLLVIEMKYGEKAVSGNASIKKHLDDFEVFYSDISSINNFKYEMLKIFQQKRLLGLIPCLSEKGNTNEVKEFEEDMEMVFLIANHDPASAVLRREISSISPGKAKFITGNFLGYGLFLENHFESDFFIERYNEQL